MGKSENQSVEREAAVNALVNVYIGKQRLEDALKAACQGASSQTRHTLLMSIFAVEYQGINQTIFFIRMALEVAFLGMSEAMIQDFVGKIIKEDWLGPESHAQQDVFIKAKDNMPQTVELLINPVIRAYISDGCFLAAQRAAKLLDRELSESEINAVIERCCKDGSINNALHVIKNTARRSELTIEEIRMLTEAVG